MNTVLGVALILMNGGIHGAMPVDAYPSVEACHKDASEFLHKHPLNLPDGATVDFACVDLTEYLNPAPKGAT